MTHTRTWPGWLRNHLNNLSDQFKDIWTETYPLECYQGFSKIVQCDLVFDYRWPIFTLNITRATAERVQHLTCIASSKSKQINGWNKYLKRQEAPQWDENHFFNYQVLIWPCSNIFLSCKPKLHLIKATHTASLRSKQTKVITWKLNFYLF
jgi:hypothetical protein